MSRTNNYIAGLVALAAWLFAAAALAQQNTIDAFNVAVQGGRVIVRITTKEPLAAPPASFTVSTPARIAFDFPKTGNGLGRASQEINEGELRGMNLVQVGDRTRMVLNLRNMVDLRDAGRGQQRQHRADPDAGDRRTAHAARRAIRRGNGRRQARDPRRRLPARPRRRRPRGDRARRHQHGHRHPPAGPAADRGFSADQAPRQPAQASRRGGLCHSGIDDQHVPAG